MRRRHNKFLSTHSLGVDEIMCHRVSIIQKVRIVEIGTVDQLRAQAQLEHGDLEEVFLKLTGDADFGPLLDSLRPSLTANRSIFYSETISGWKFNEIHSM